MNALKTANQKFDAAIAELCDTTESKPDRRSQLPATIRAYIAGQRQLTNALFQVAFDIDMGTWGTRTRELAWKILIDATKFELEELERLGDGSNGEDRI